MSQNTKRSAKMLRGDGSCVWCLYLVYFLILLDLATRCTEAYGSPSSDFSTHSIVRPKFHHGRTKREIATTQDETGSHHPEVTLTVSIDGEDHELELRLNEALVPHGHSLSYQEGGQTKVHTSAKEELDLCQYSGHVRGRSGSWAAVSTCRGVRGVLYDGERLRYIEPVDDNDINADHFLYSHEDLTREHRCGYEGGTTHNSSYDPMLFQQRTEELARKRSRISRYKRDTFEDTLVREPYNADRRSRYVELVLVVDHGEFLASGGDLPTVHRQMKDLANIINSVYAPLNIFIALVGVEVWSENDEIVLEEDGDATLNKFLHYRKTVLVTRIPNDNAQLLTRQNFKAGVVGKALKGFMCSYNYSAGVATNHSRVIGLVAMTIAHEMGHNFGMEHDQEPDCECPDKKCIMSPSSTSVTPVHWSSCSLKSLALSFERGMDYCLRNKPAQLFSSPTCGNGFLESGEQCDCGAAPGSRAPAPAGACARCCRPDCTLRTNATCGHGQCCDFTVTRHLAKPKRLFESPTCGNGFLESGEQCDCGAAPGSRAPAPAGACARCCRPDCTLRTNATCGHGQCCDFTVTRHLAKPKRLFSSPTCGNGFLESGEQCDCGAAPGSRAPAPAGACARCCRPDCTLRTNATCGHGQCCDFTVTRHLAKPKRLFSSPTCGNGFLESGEQCDCGAAPGSRAPAPAGACARCCRPDCTLRTNATCGHGQCCDFTVTRHLAKPKRLFSSPTCGNGFLESGEQCDCGAAPGSRAPAPAGACARCCRPDCTLRTNATCGHGQCCDFTVTRHLAKPKRLFSSPTCGNGFLESGEQCDCGAAPGSRAPAPAGACARCCRPDCTLRTNATCGHGQCCDFTVTRHLAKPKRLFSSPTCGNGFLESGEQCDCGAAPGSRAPAPAGACARCCRPDCTLRTNATCGHGQCCDFTVTRHLAKPKRLFSSPTCGNGFLESGEQCDCGAAPGSRAPAPAGACARCCRPDCTLRTNATCGHGQCCDFTTCRPKAAGTVCRGADRECDLPEYCSGHSQFCPHDTHKMDATPCAGGQAYCVRGSCRSHTDQCRLLWGVTGNSSDEKCYNNSNIKGDDHGNCGYDRVNQIYRRCAPQDVMCGMLQCRHLNERLEFGMENAAVLTATFINNNGVIIPCRTVIIDLGLSDVDPGLVPDGAKCGTDKMCVQQKCVPVERVRAEMAAREGAVCPSNCSGHGVCNSNGNCHCEAGFAPPACALPGPGGSYDSGPATDPSVQRNFMVVMYVIFLGIIPGILLIMFLVFYSRHNVLVWWKKPRKSVQSPKSSLQHRISRGAHKLAANFTQQPPPPPAPRPDDMSSSLLAQPSPPPHPTVNFFGNFKGFSLAPIDKEDEKEKEKEPIKSAKITPVHRSSSNSQNLVNQGVLKPVLRSAPPLPVVPATSPKTSPSIKRTNSSVQRIKALIKDKEDITPVMTNPPPRPVISSPILEASTCTAKELMPPIGWNVAGPVRAAPTVPTISPDLPKRPLSMHASTVPQKPLPEEPKKVREGISLNRIASFLKQEKPKEKERSPVERSHSLPKNPNNQVKLPKAMDKVALRNLQISNPILQKGIELPVGTVPVISDSEDAEDPKTLNRAQSMRAAPVVPKAALQSFGSMRQPSGAPRPVSGAGRPTAPPPPAPELPVYQNPKPIDIKSTDYVDCIEEKQAPLAHIDEESGDNIYAIIEESPEKRSKPLPGVPPVIKTIPQPPPVGYNTPKPIPANSGSTESMGLLGEIVDEIQNRNFDSIYSTSTLRKKKGRAKETSEGDRDSTYMNTAPESVYSNSGKSVASTTSSGYLHPSAVNVPTFLNKDKVDKQEEKAPPSPKANSKIPQFSRQVTPPNLRTTTFKAVPQSPKAASKIINPPKIANSPDVVSSCAVTDKTVKAPDVINNNKPSETPKVAAKPSITAKPNDNRPPLRPAPTVDKKPVKPALKPVSTPVNKPLNRTNSKVDSNITAIADNINKNKPKVVPKPTTISVQRTDSNLKPNASKLTSKPSNVASLQQKFENRKSISKEPVAKK